MHPAQSTPPPGWESPQTPDQPTPPPRRSLVKGVIAWTLALTVLILPVGISFIRERGDHGEAYGTGAALGTAFLILAVALGVRALHQRLTHRETGAPLQAFVAIVAVLAIGGQYLWRANERANAASDMAAAAAACRTADPRPFGEAPAGTDIDDLDILQRVAFNADLERQGQLPDGLDATDIAAAAVVDRNGEIRAIVLGFPGVSQLDGGEAGLEAAVFPGGAPPQATPAGVRFVTGPTPAGTVALGANGCWTLLVADISTGSEASLSELARPLFAG